MPLACRMRVRAFFWIFAALLLASCAGPRPVLDDNAPLLLKPAQFSDLPGWRDDRPEAALAAFAQSCPRLQRQAAGAAFGADPAMGTYGDWQRICAALPAEDAGAFLERYFQPWQATAGGAATGLFTGYYEAALRGSRTRHGAYQYPLRRRPADLVTVELGDFRPALKGQRLAGRVVAGGRLKPYPDRAEIARAGLPGDAADIFVWVDDPVDAFFLQVQGSGRILLEDGTDLRVGFDGQNGWPYTAIGRELIARGELDRDAVSMASIRAWLQAHPAQRDEVMNTDRSYVFFRELPGGASGPPGAEGVPLTPGRSLAVDHARLPYGVPVWLDADPPQPGQARFRRLMVAQDTGGAIRGAVRGDVFWGYGPDAAAQAGAMKSPGRMWLLLPRR